MRVSFICLDLGINGGTKSIIDMANALHDLGHTVNIIYPKYAFPNITNHSSLIWAIGGPFMRFKRQITGHNFSDTVSKMFKVRCNLIKVPFLSNKYIPEADFVFATWWETAKYVQKLDAKKGKKCYFIQHYEAWGGKKQKVDSTYQMGFISIVHSTWLKNIIKKETGVKADALITHVPDHNLFHFDNKRKDKDQIKVVMIYRNIEWKGMDYGIKAFEKAKLECSNLQLILIGEKPKNIIENATFVERPSTEVINDLYNTSDIFVFPSLEEGFGLPPMEAMCCKLPVVSTNVGAIPDYSKNNESALISEPKDIDAMAKNIILLAKNKKLRIKLGEKAYQNMKDYSWNNSAKKLEGVLEKALRRNE